MHPLERILIETAHPSGDHIYTSRRQTGSFDGVEQSRAQVYSVDVQVVRGQVWTNFARLVGETSVESLIPTAAQRMIVYARANGGS